MSRDAIVATICANAHLKCSIRSLSLEEILRYSLIKLRKVVIRFSEHNRHCELRYQYQNSSIFSDSGQYKRG